MGAQEAAELLTFIRKEFDRNHDGKIDYPGKLRVNVFIPKQ